jgi:20S proteasome subunit alpha 7
MSSIGTGYDLYTTSYSPDGRVFQVEYANKAVESSGTALAVKCKDGLVLGFEKLVLSKMLCEGTCRRLLTVDNHVGIAVSGMLADGRQLVNRARDEAAQYREFYGHPIPGKVLAERVAGFVHAYTMYWSVRPFGVSVLIATKDSDGDSIWMVEPSGLTYSYSGCAIGKGKQASKVELEKLKLTEMTCREAAKEVARIIYSVHDDVKDKEFELELSWICQESGNRHQLVPKDIVAEAEEYAKAALDEDMDD